MLRRVARRLQSGVTRPGWAERKLAEVSLLNRELTSIISQVNTLTAQELGRLVAEAQAAGAASASQVLTAASVEPLQGVFTRISPRAVEALYAQTVGQITTANLRILRATLDAYRAIVAESASLGVTGVLTRREVSQRAIDRLAAQGLSGFTDTLGRRWGMDAYAEMSARTAITRSFIEGRLSQITRYTDLVRVDDSPEECPFCRPWEGRVLTVSGHTPGYPTLQDAIGAGLMHANCTHSVNAYFPDDRRTLGLMGRTHADPQAYREREYQRYLERNVREWKRREAVAVPGSPEQRRAKQKVREWQSRSRKFTDDTGRRRLYDRESITATGRRAG